MPVKRLEDLIFRHAARAIRHLARPALISADPALRLLYRQLSEEFQVAPPVVLHASAPELVAGYWHAARETYVVGPHGRAKREAVAAAVSEINHCPYCETVHAGLFAAAGGGGLASALPEEVRGARDWAAATLSPGSMVLRQPAVAPEEIPQIFGTAVIFHYTNRMVSLFLGQSPLPLPGMASPAGTRLAKRMMAVMGRRIAGYAASSGGAVIRRDAVLPADFAWARGAPHVAAGLAHFALAAEEAGAEDVPEPVRDLVLSHLTSWRGEAAPLSRGWLGAWTDPLDASLRPAARLALLTARAPWQIDDGLVAEFRRIAPGDRALVRTAGWAAFAAARRIARWFPLPAENPQSENAA